MISALLALLAPLGMALTLWGGLPEARARSAAARVLAVVGLTALGYMATGFALQYGALGCLHDLPGLAALTVPRSLAIAPEWGLFGDAGWWLAVAPEHLAGVLGLYLAQFPWVLSLTLVAGIGLIGRERGVGSWLSVLGLAAVIGPLAAGWTWAGGLSAHAPFPCPNPLDLQDFTVNYGGWLGNLGTIAGWGHGFIDYGGAGTIHLLAGAVVLAAMLTFGPRRVTPGPEDVVELPPVHLPLLAVLGLGLWLVGWLAWPLAHPLYAGLAWPLVALNALLAVGAGTVVAQVYTAFTAGHADALMAVRGGAAGLVAVSASAPFIAPWAAVVIGVLAGLLVPLVQYVVEAVWGQEDVTAAVAVHAVGGLWGVLAVGLLANGQQGVGWNVHGVEAYLGTPPQGVGGLIVAPGLVSDLTQMNAQLVGAVVLIALGFVPALILFQLVKVPARLAAARAAVGVGPEAGAAVPSVPASVAVGVEVVPVAVEVVAERVLEPLVDAPVEGVPDESVLVAVDMVPDESASAAVVDVVPMVDAPIEGMPVESAPAAVDAAGESAPMDPMASPSASV